MSLLLPPRPVCPGGRQCVRGMRVPHGRGEGGLAPSRERARLRGRQHRGRPEHPVPPRRGRGAALARSAVQVASMQFDACTDQPGEARHGIVGVHGGRGTTCPAGATMPCPRVCAARTGRPQGSCGRPTTRPQRARSPLRCRRPSSSSPTGDLSHTRFATLRCRGRTAPGRSARFPGSRSVGRSARSLGNVGPRIDHGQFGFDLAPPRPVLPPLRLGLAQARLDLRGRQQVPARLRVEEPKHRAVGPDPIGRWPFCGDNGHKDSSCTRQRNATVRTICATVRTICVGVGKRLC